MSQPFVYSDQRPASDTSSHPPYENTLYRRDSRQEQVFQIPYSALIEQLEKSGQLGELGQLGLVDESEEWGEKPLEQSRRPLPLLPPLSPLSPLSSQGARKEDSGQEGEVSYKGQPLYQPHQPYHPQSQHQSQQPYNAFILQGEEHQPRRSASRYSTTQPWSPNPSTSPTRVARYSTIERPGRVESMKIEVPQPLPTHPQDAPLKLQKPFDPSTSSSTLDIDALALSLGVDMSKPRNSMEFLLSHHNKRHSTGSYSLQRTNTVSTFPQSVSGIGSPLLPITPSTSTGRGMPDPPMKKDASHPFSNSIPPTSPILTSPSTALVSSHSTKVAMDLPTQADTQADKKNPTDLGSMHIDIPSAPDPQKSRLSIASFSLTHHQDAIKTYRRMAAKTRDKNVQMTYCHYLFEIAALYPVDTRTNTTRHRLLTEAGYWIETLAKGGHPEALLIKGQWYQEGPQAQQCVGMGYTKVQPQKALRCYQQSAKAGNIEAYYRLGNHWKSQNMKERASTHYAWAAARGHVHANYEMARLLLSSKIKKPKDVAAGMEYLQSAADSEPPASAQACYVLSCIYGKDYERVDINSHLSIDYNPTLSLLYLTKAIQSGLSDAIHKMALVKEHGLLEQTKDMHQALVYYTKAAEQDHTEAMLDLIRIYSSPPIQPDMALKWCHCASEKGVEKADYLLGVYYEEGFDQITPDYPRALSYFTKAASKGYLPAEERLNRPLGEVEKRPQRHQCFVM